MIHTGERPHRCPECRKGFITMSAMKKHRMVHFKTGPAYDTKQVSCHFFYLFVLLQFEIIMDLLLEYFRKKILTKSWKYQK